MLEVNCGSSILGKQRPQQTFAGVRWAEFLVLKYSLVYSDIF